MDAWRYADVEEFFRFLQIHQKQVKESLKKLEKYGRAGTDRLQRGR